MSWKANGAMNLPLAERARPWDADAAERRVRAWAGGESDMDWAKYRKAFFAWDDERADTYGGYKLQFADIVDGELMAIPRGIMAVAAVLQGGRGGVDLPDDVQDTIRANVAAYYAKWDEQPPWERKSVDVPDVREGRVLSEKNRRLIEEAIRQAREAIDALQELLDSTALSADERRAIARELMAVRQISPTRIGGYAIVWGGKDLYGTWFTPETDTWRDVNPNPPLLYDHGFNPDIGAERLGRVVVRRIDDIGEWVEAELSAHEQYLQAISELLKKNPTALGWSTGSARHLVDVETDGRIRRWPVVEVSLTPTPAEPRTLGVQELRSIGFSAEELRLLGMGNATRAVDEATGGANANPNAGQEHTKGDAEMENKVKKEGDMGVPASEARGAYAVPAVNTTPLGDDAVKAFVHWARTGDTSAVKSAVVWAEGTGTTGGVLVPDDIYNTVIAKLTEMSVARALGAPVYQTSRDVVKVPVLNPLAGFAQTSEASAYNETEETPFDEVSVTVYKYTRMVKVTEELLEDSVFDVAALLATAFADAQAQTENSLFIAGTGSGSPQGVLAGGTLGVTLASTSVITAGEVADLYYALSSKYRQDSASVAWVMRDSTERVIRKLQASSSAGEFLFISTPAGVLEDSLLGRRVFNSDAVPALGSAGNKVIAFGNWRYYTIVENKGLVVLRDPYTYAGDGKIGFLARFRVGGAVAVPAAFVYARCATS